MSTHGSGRAAASRLSVTARVFVALTVVLLVVGWYASREFEQAGATLARANQIRALSTHITALTELGQNLANEAANRSGVVYAEGVGVPTSVVKQTIGIDLDAQLEAAVERVDTSLSALAADAPMTATDLTAARSVPGGTDHIAQVVDEARTRAATQLHRMTATEGGQFGMDQAADDLALATDLSGRVTHQTFSTLNLIFPLTPTPLERRLRDLIRTRDETTEALTELAGHDGPVGAAARALRDSPTYIEFLRVTDDQLHVQLDAGGAGKPFSLTEVSNLRDVWLSSNSDQAQARAIVTVASDTLQLATRRLTDATRAGVVRQRALLAATLLAVALLSLWILRTIVRPIQALERHALQLAAGDPPAEALPVRGARELRVAASALNQLVDALGVVERQASALAAGDVDSPALTQQLPGRLGGALTGAVRQLTGSISSSQVLTERLAHEANHDGLTALSNRRMVLPALEQAIRRADERGVSVAALFIDLDRFKSVNDGHGHDAGDQVLVVVADRLRAVVRRGDLIARLGGDEFLVIVENVPGAATTIAMELGARIVEVIEAPIALRDGSSVAVGLSASVGVAVYRRGQGADDLLSTADQAMYDAKAAGRGRVALGEPLTATPTAVG